MRLERKIVAITGAGSGIGRALALEVARHHGIPILLDVNESGLRETAALIDAIGGRSDWHVLDIRDAEQWSALADKVCALHGHVDILVNNAGVMNASQNFLDIDIRLARLTFDVNMFGMFNGVRTFAPLLAKRPEAMLINVSSSMSLVGSPLYSIYVASKCAVTGFTYILREELSRSRIRVMTVFPGVTKTNLGRNALADDKAALNEHADHFDKLAFTTPEHAARKIVKGIERNRKVVCTSFDAKLQQILSGLAPIGGHKLLAFAMRKLASPKLFARLDGLAE